MKKVVMHTPIIDAACAGIRAVCVPYSNINHDTIDDICAIIRGEKVAVEAKKIIEPPMPCKEAAHLLGISKTALHYHIRAGRIRRVTVPGASRGRGVVAADVRAILNGGTISKAERGEV